MPVSNLMNRQARIPTLLWHNFYNFNYEKRKTFFILFFSFAIVYDCGCRMPRVHNLCITIKEKFCDACLLRQYWHWILNNPMRLLTNKRIKPPSYVTLILMLCNFGLLMYFIFDSYVYLVVFIATFIVHNNHVYLNMFCVYG